MTDQTREAIEVAKDLLTRNKDDYWGTIKEKLEIEALSHLISIAERATDEEELKSVILASKAISMNEETGEWVVDDIRDLAHAIVKFIGEGK